MRYKVDFTFRSKIMNKTKKAQDADTVVDLKNKLEAWKRYALALEQYTTDNDVPEEVTIETIQGAYNRLVELGELE